MGRKSKSTVADEAVQAALTAAQAVADVESPEDLAVAVQVAEEAIKSAEAAAKAAGKSAEVAESIQAARALVATDTDDGDPEAVAAAEAKAKAEAKPPVTKARTAEPEVIIEPKVKPKPADHHVVAPGKALTTLARGIVGPGDRIDAEDLGGGTAALAAFVESGHVVAPR